MDLYWYARDRMQGKQQPLLQWEFGAAKDWDSVGPPAQLGKRLFEALTQRPLDAEWAPLTNNLMHWGYGSQCALLYGIAAGSTRDKRIAYGLLLGGGVWLSSYIILPIAKLYQPIWMYDAKTLATDLGAHLAYGVATAAAFKALS